MPIGQNPNIMELEDFERALDLADESEEEDDRPHPKVGAVIVKKGEVIAEAFRGEIGEGDHAEFIALERKARGKSEVNNADLITTLEPCTERSHDKRPCVDWIRTRRIRKVWIGTLDYNPVIRGNGEAYLREHGILVGRFPDEYQTRILEQNQDFFKYIQKLQPELSQNELKERVRTIRELVLTELKEMNRLRTRVASNPETREIRRHLVGAHRRILTIEPNDQHAWDEIGWSLHSAQLPGLAGFAFQTSTKIDTTNYYGWIGYAWSQIRIHDSSPKPVETLKYCLLRATKYLKRAYDIDSTPNTLHRQGWEVLAARFENLDDAKRAHFCREIADSLVPK